MCVGKEGQTEHLNVWSRNVGVLYGGIRFGQDLGNVETNGEQRRKQTAGSWRCRLGTGVGVVEEAKQV